MSLKSLKQDNIKCLSVPERSTSPHKDLKTSGGVWSSYRLCFLNNKKYFIESKNFLSSLMFQWFSWGLIYFFLSFKNVNVLDWNNVKIIVSLNNKHRKFKWCIIESGHLKIIINMLQPDCYGSLFPPQWWQNKDS